MKLVLKVEMIILVVRIVVKSEKHHTMRIDVFFCWKDPGEPRVKPVKDDASWYKLSLHFHFWSDLFFYIRSLLLLAILLNIKPNGNMERHSWQEWEHTKVCRREVFRPLLSTVWSTREATTLFLLSVFFHLFTLGSLSLFNSEQHIHDSQREFCSSVFICRSALCSCFR